ncbi:acyltransferase family protein [Colwellia sp. PAMC 21821]|uniref:acyltransferase family protein n=1 Tax=Colwellia sp. PAMC 21821 TaxID=1816219 RepID=UPI003369D2BC
MIFLVVFGHLIEPLINQNDFIKTIYMFIYSFHMPVFIILAGVLTKLDMTDEQTTKNIRTLIVPFLVFTILYEIVNLISNKSISQ